MPKYLIERVMPGAGTMSADDRRAASQSSCEVIQSLAPDLQWQHSYFTDDKVFCVFIAKDEEVIRQHAERGGFPITEIYDITATTDPMTAQG